MKYTISLLALLCAMLVKFLVPYTALSSTDYSYSRWRSLAHVPVPACTLSGDKHAANGGIECDETSLLPSRDQIIAWESYTIWDSCVEFGSRYACAEMEN